MTGDVVTTGIIREVILPAIEQEINEGKNFANLRQIYNALILATWYKQRLKDSLLGKVYVDQNKTRGIDTQDKEINQKIYGQYIESFKKGVYNFIKEDVDPATREIIPRKYFSGGMAWKLGGLKKVGALALGTLLSFGSPDVGDASSLAAAAMGGNKDGVTTEFVDNAKQGDIGTAIVVKEGAVQPVLLAQTASSSVGKDNEQGRGVGERGQEKPVILLVDDEERWRESYKEWLSGSYEIIEASDGQEALKKIKSEEGVRIGLVFSDQNMRRMNGNVLAGIIKKDFPNLPVIIATATSDEDFRTYEQGLKEGLPNVVTVLDKETMVQGMVLKAVQQALEDSGSPASSPVKIASVGTEDKEFFDRVWEMFEKGDVHGKGEGAKRVEEFLGKAKRTIREKGETHYTIGDVLYLSYIAKDKELWDDEDLFFEPEIAQSVPTVSIRSDKKRLFLAMAGDPSVVLDVVLEENGAMEAQFISSDKFLEIVRVANSSSSPVVEYYPWESDELKKFQENGLDFVGTSEAIQKVRKEIIAAANGNFDNTPIIVYGETGTGKELTTHALHKLGPNSSKEFKKINANTLTIDEIKEYIKTNFGIENGGTVVFDGIEDLHGTNLQGALLNILEPSAIEKSGILFIATRNKPWPNDYRRDLIARFQIKIDLPSLEERKKDIPLIFEFLNKKMSAKAGLSWKPLSQEAGLFLADYPNYKHIDGQIRTIEQVVKKILLNRKTKEIESPYIGISDIVAAGLPSTDRHHPDSASVEIYVFKSLRDLTDRSGASRLLRLSHGDRPYYSLQMYNKEIMVGLLEKSVSEEDAKNRINEINALIVNKNFDFARILGVTGFFAERKFHYNPKIKIRLALGEALPDGQYSVKAFILDSPGQEFEMGSFITSLEGDVNLLIAFSTWAFSNYEGIRLEAYEDYYKDAYRIDIKDEHAWRDAILKGKTRMSSTSSPVEQTVYTPEEFWRLINQIANTKTFFIDLKPVNSIGLTRITMSDVHRWWLNGEFRKLVGKYNGHYLGVPVSEIVQIAETQWHSLESFSAVAGDYIKRGDELSVYRRGEPNRVDGRFEEIKGKRLWLTGLNGVKISIAEDQIMIINAASSPASLSVSEERVPTAARLVGMEATNDKGPATKGGIDLNPALLDLQIKRDGNGVPLPLPQQPIETMHIEGFLPIIINVTPITNLPMLLGLADTEQDADEITPAMKARDPEEISVLN